MYSKKIINWMLGIAILILAIVLSFSFVINPINIDAPPTSLNQKLKVMEHFISHNDGTIFIDGIVNLQVDHDRNVLMVIVDVEKWEYNLQEDRLLQRKWEQLTGYPYSVAYFDSNTMECCH